MLVLVLKIVGIPLNLLTMSLTLRPVLEYFNILLAATDRHVLLHRY